jgi:steroid delta-isomerase-like uncharacterized protein
MSTDANKDLVRSFIERVYTQLDPAAVDELVADDFQAHGMPAAAGDKDGLRQATQRMAAALSDISFSIHDLIAEGDLVCARLTSSARQIGEFMGIPPTNRTYQIEEIHIFRVRDGQIVEHWHQLDAMGLMAQLRDEKG